MSLYFLIRCIGFSLLKCCLGFVVVQAYLSAECEWVNMQAVVEVRNTYRHSLLWLVQYGARGKCPSFCCKDFFVTFFNFKFMLMPIFNSTVQSVPCHSNNMRQARQGRRFNHDQRESATGICSVREFATMCVLPKTEKREQHSIIENATYCCVLSHVSRYITPNCIPEDQLTLKCNGGIHKCT
jgi:hypothetical protein